MRGHTRSQHSFACVCKSKDNIPPKKEHKWEMSTSLVTGELETVHTSGMLTRGAGEVRRAWALTLLAGTRLMQQH